MTYFTAKDEMTSKPPRADFRMLALEALVMLAVVGVLVKLF
ncbi:MAG: hypothetical protein PVG66_07515 [Chromatiales bacterium]|jgi:hypothetical protein